jgi:MFS family permease
MAGFIVLNPYQTARRAELDCGPVCLGSMTSAYSALGLVGAPLVGALSDNQGRRFALALGTFASILSLIIMGTTFSLAGLWLSLVPGALLAHNFTVTKAVVADLAPHEERAGMMGKFGLAAGLGFMAGPVFNPFITSFREALLYANPQVPGIFRPISLLTRLRRRRSDANWPEVMQVFLRDALPCSCRGQRSLPLSFRRCLYGLNSIWQTIFPLTVLPTRSERFRRASQPAVRPQLRETRGL